MIRLTTVNDAEQLNILNNQYFYPTKWLTAGLDHLQEDFGLKDALSVISTSHNEDVEYAEYNKRPTSVLKAIR